MEEDTHDDVAQRLLEELRYYDNGNDDLNSDRSWNLLNEKTQYNDGFLEKVRRFTETSQHPYGSRGRVTWTQKEAVNRSGRIPDTGNYSFKPATRAELKDTSLNHRQGIDSVHNKSNSLPQPPPPPPGPVFAHSGLKPGKVALQQKLKPKDIRDELLTAINNRQYQGRGIKSPENGDSVVSDTASSSAYSSNSSSVDQGSTSGVGSSRISSASTRGPYCSSSRCSSGLSENDQTIGLQHTTASIFKQPDSFPEMSPNLNPTIRQTNYQNVPTFLPHETGHHRAPSQPQSHPSSLCSARPPRGSPRQGHYMNDAGFRQWEPNGGTSTRPSSSTMPGASSGDRLLRKTQDAYWRDIYDRFYRDYDDIPLMKSTGDSFKPQRRYHRGASSSTLPLRNNFGSPSRLEQERFSVSPCRSVDVPLDSTTQARIAYYGRSNGAPNFVGGQSSDLADPLSRFRSASGHTNAERPRVDARVMSPPRELERQLDDVLRECQRSWKGQQKAQERMTGHRQENSDFEEDGASTPTANKNGYLPVNYINPPHQPQPNALPYSVPMAPSSMHSSQSLVRKTYSEPPRQQIDPKSIRGSPSIVNVVERGGSYTESKFGPGVRDHSPRSSSSQLSSTPSGSLYAGLGVPCSTVMEPASAPRPVPVITARNSAAVFSGYPSIRTAEKFQNNGVGNQDKIIYGQCGVCTDAVTDDAGACQALGRLYHEKCFCCNICGGTLRGKTFYNVGGKIYCEECYLFSGFQEAAEKCFACGHPIMDMILQAVDKAFHPTCFRCRVCAECLDGVPFTVDSKGDVYCVSCYHRLFAPTCSGCGKAITPLPGSDETVRVVSMNKDFHIDCYICEGSTGIPIPNRDPDNIDIPISMAKPSGRDQLTCRKLLSKGCGLQLTDEPHRRCYPLDDHLLCHRCHALWARTGTGRANKAPISDL